MHRISTLLIAAAAAAFFAQASAQTTYKCKDKAGKITYSSNECSLLGLLPAGEVADRMNTAPGYKAPPRPATPSGSAVAPSPAAQGGAPAAAKKEDGPDPNRRCFTRQVKTAKGVTSVTNCNEKPDESAAPSTPGDASGEIKAQ